MFGQTSNSLVSLWMLCEPLAATFLNFKTLGWR